MSRYKFTRLTVFWNYCCISLLLTYFIDCGLSACSKLSSKTCWYHFSVNCILSKITDISGKCFEDCSGKEKFECKYICWDAVLVPFHWRSHWSSKFLCPTFTSHQHSISFQMHVILASSRKALSCVQKTIVPSLSGVCRVVPNNSCLAYALACPCMN